MTRRIIPENDNSLKRFYREHPVLTHFAAICLTALVLVLGVFFVFDIFTHHGSSTVVPEVKSMSYSDAVRALEAADLKVEIADSVYVNPDSIPPGTVVEIWPSEGSVVKPGRDVFLVITSFTPGMVTVGRPLVNIASSQAVSILNRLGIDRIRKEYVPGEYPDQVLHALYNGREIFSGMQIPMNATVVLQVSSGRMPAPVAVEAPDTLDIDEILMQEQPVQPEPVEPQPEDDPNSIYD